MAFTTQEIMEDFTGIAKWRSMLDVCINCPTQMSCRSAPAAMASDRAVALMPSESVPYLYLRDPLLVRERIRLIEEPLDSLWVFNYAHCTGETSSTPAIVFKKSLCSFFTLLYPSQKQWIHVCRIQRIHILFSFVHSYATFITRKHSPATNILHAGVRRIVEAGIIE